MPYLLTTPEKVIDVFKERVTNVTVPDYSPDSLQMVLNYMEKDGWNVVSVSWAPMADTGIGQLLLRKGN